MIEAEHLTSQSGGCGQGLSLFYNDAFHRCQIRLLGLQGLLPPGFPCTVLRYDHISNTGGSSWFPIQQLDRQVVLSRNDRLHTVPRSYPALRRREMVIDQRLGPALSSS